MTPLMVLSVCCILMVYGALILYFSLGWYKLQKSKSPAYKTPTFVSVLIAVRNETSQIKELIHHLRQQKFPASSFEVIISDDFSTDNTCNLVLHEIKDLNNFRLIQATSGELTGKKAAIHRALKASRGEIILTTDADCRMGNHWIETMTGFMDAQTQMVAGPVDIDSSDGKIFSSLQSLEFMSLQGATAGAISMKKPVMCNAANLAWRKQAFQKIKENIGGQNLSSGDDVFLLHAMQKAFPGQIRFAKNQEALVMTKPAPNLPQFFRQRTRWASKSFSYTNTWAIFTGTVVALINLCISVGLLWGIYNGDVLFFAAILLAGKTLFDLPLLTGVAWFMRKQRLLWWVLPLQIIYPFYIATTILLAGTYRPTWKNRRISTG